MVSNVSEKILYEYETMLQLKRLKRRLICTLVDMWNPTTACLDLEFDNTTLKTSRFETCRSNVWRKRKRSSGGNPETYDHSRSRLYYIYLAYWGFVVLIIYLWRLQWQHWQGPHERGFCNSLDNIDLRVQNNTKIAASSQTILWPQKSDDDYTSDWTISLSRSSASGYIAYRQPSWRIQ